MGPQDTHADVYADNRAMRCDHRAGDALVTQHRGRGRLYPPARCFLTPAPTGWVIVAVAHLSTVASSPLRQGRDVKKNEPESPGHLVIESKAAIIDSADVGLGVHRLWNQLAEGGLTPRQVLL